jgi:hypothetical protein
MEKPRKGLKPVSVAKNKPAHVSGLSRRRMMTLVTLPVVALVLAGSGYLVLCQQKTQRIETMLAANTAKVRDGRQALNTAVKKANAKGRIALLQQVGALSELDCNSPNFLYPPLVEALQQCESHNKKMSSLQQSLKEVAATLQYDESIKSLLAGSRGIDARSESGWVKQQEAWTAVATTLSKTSAPAELRSAHAVLTKQAVALSKAWAVAQSANKAQDIEAYRAAKKALAKQYENLRKISESYEKEYSTIQYQLVKAYEGI